MKQYRIFSKESPPKDSLSSDWIVTLNGVAVDAIQASIHHGWVEHTVLKNVVIGDKTFTVTKNIRENGVVKIIYTGSNPAYDKYRA